MTYKVSILGLTTQIAIKRKVLWIKITNTIVTVIIKIIFPQSSNWNKQQMNKNIICPESKLQSISLYNLFLLNLKIVV